MKILYFLLCIVSVNVYSQTNIRIDAGNVLKKLNGHENGINLDYLMDGSFLNPSTSPTQSIKNINVGLLRYPGGEKSDNYLFSAAPYNSASPRMALKDSCFWPTNDNRFVDINSADKVCLPAVLDFDEYMAMCNATGATPLVVVAYDAIYNTRSCGGKPTKAQLLTNAVEWVRYANVKKGWKVKYWMIGNESWNNPAYNGRVTATKYAEDIADFASGMKAVDPDIKIIANGRSDWWQTILESSAVSLIDFFALSEYPTLDYTGGYEYYRKNDVDLTAQVDKAIDDINTYAPAAHRNRIKVIASEYNSIDWNGQWPADNNLGHALANFQMFGDLVVKPRLETACMWNTRWVENAVTPYSLYDAFDANGNMNATAAAVKVWGTNLLSLMVKATSSDLLVRSYASYDSANKKLNILLLNKDLSPRQAHVDLSNYLSDFTGEVWQLKGTSVDDHAPKYQRTGSIKDSSDLANFSIPAASVMVLKLEKKQKAPTDFSFTFQPNPFNRNPKIKVISADDIMMTIVVSDIMGRIVHRQNLFFWKGENVVDMIHLASLQNGVYFVKVADNQHAQTLKIVRK